MVGDGDTVPEGPRAALIRARHVADDSSRAVVRSALGSADPRDRVLALRAGAAHEWLTARDWSEGVVDLDARVRREAASLLAREPAEASLDALLVTALVDEDPLVADAAAFALGERESTTAVDALMSVASSHEDARCRESAVAALGSIGDDRAVDTIIAALADKPPVRRRAVVALSNFEGPKVDAALDAARDDRDWQVRAAVDQLDRSMLDDEDDD